MPFVQAKLHISVEIAKSAHKKSQLSTRGQLAEESAKSRAKTLQPQNKRELVTKSNVAMCRFKTD